MVSVAYLALVPDPGDPVAGSDAADAAWRPVAATGSPGARSRSTTRRILRDGVERARAKLEYTSLAAALIPEPFTVNELREVYAAVWGVEPDPRNFHRKVTSADGFVVETDETTTRGGGRPGPALPPRTGRAAAPADAARLKAIRPPRPDAVRWRHRRSSRHQRRASGRTGPRDSQ